MVDAPVPLSQMIHDAEKPAPEKHPLILVLARAVHSLVSAEHQAAIVEALADYGRGKEFVEPEKPGLQRPTWTAPRGFIGLDKPDMGPGALNPIYPDTPAGAKAKAEADRAAAMQST